MFFIEPNYGYKFGVISLSCFLFGGNITHAAPFTNEVGDVTGEAAIAIGQNSIADGDYTISVGSKSKANKEKSVAVGFSAEAIGEKSIAVGNEAKAEGTNSMALGNEAKATSLSTVAVGNKANASRDHSTAVGNWATASGVQSSAFGNYATSIGMRSTAVGAHAKAIGNGTVAIGTLTEAKADFAVAIGNGAKSEASAVAIGLNTNANASSVAIGNKTQADGAFAVALGESSKASATSSISLGKNSEATHVGSIALGSGAKATGESLKEKAYLQSESSLVKGIGGDLAGELNIANSSQQRRITGVAAGATDTDAVNVSQLKVVNDKVDGLNQKVKDLVNLDNLNSQAIDVANDLRKEIDEFDDKLKEADKKQANQIDNLNATDAKHSDQINELFASNSKLSAEIHQLDAKINKFDKQAKAGIASAIAIASLPQPIDKGYSMLSLGTGAWDGESSLALGASGITEDKTIFNKNVNYIWKFASTTNSQNKWGGGASVGIQWK
jgi:autotransporter adhesin